MGRLSNKVAVITGAISGIGLESTYLFASEGCKIIAGDINDSVGETVMETVRKKTGNPDIKYVHCDVSKESDVMALINEALSTSGGLDILFNNAGIMHIQDGGVDEIDEKIWDLTMNVNLKGVWYGCKHAIRVMRELHSKEKHSSDASKFFPSRSIINTASFVASIGAATPQIAYTASKGAVLALTKELAVTHSRDNIRVNSLSPGPLNTKLLMDFLDTPDKLYRRLVHIPIGRFGEANEVARAALFLASDESSYITGLDMKVDGGVTAAYVTPEGLTLSMPPYHQSFHHDPSEFNMDSNNNPSS